MISNFSIIVVIIRTATSTNIALSGKSNEGVSFYPFLPNLHRGFPLPFSTVRSRMLVWL